MGVSGWLARHVVLPVARRSRVVRDTAAFVDDRLGKNGYERLRDQFILNGRDSRWDIGVRRALVARFESIDREVPIQSSPADGLVLAEAALSLSVPGDFVECGAFSGGSTAKLSLVAQLLGRRLFVFDSFEGLPDVTEAERVDFHARQAAPCTWRDGACRAPLAEVEHHVTRFGHRECCEFVPGWFAETLTPPHLPKRIALAYTDVVLPSSARTCLRALWPILQEAGVYFSRDLALTNVWGTLADPAWWHSDVGHTRPIMFGVAFGLSDASPYMGFMVKGADPPAAHVDALRIFKPLRVRQ